MNYELGGDLASIHSSKENDFVTTLVKERPIRGGEKVKLVMNSINFNF